MKAISLLQPWATLIMLGYKQYETRSWSTKHRGQLAIAASKGKPAEARQVCATDPIISALLKKHHLTFDTLPRGVVLGTCFVDNVHEVEKLPRQLSATELACGDYSPGRYAWELSEVREAGFYPPCKGALSLWELPSDTDIYLRCPKCAESLNHDALHPCFCGGEGKPEPDGEPSYTSDGHAY
jgi:hypothetical protein